MGSRCIPSSADSRSTILHSISSQREASGASEVIWSWETRRGKIWGVGTFFLQDGVWWGGCASSPEIIDFLTENGILRRILKHYLYGSHAWSGRSRRSAGLRYNPGKIFSNSKCEILLHSGSLIFWTRKMAGECDVKIILDIALTKHGSTIWKCNCYIVGNVVTNAGPRFKESEGPSPSPNPRFRCLWPAPLSLCKGRSVVGFTQSINQSINLYLKSVFKISI